MYKVGDIVHVLRPHCGWFGELDRCAKQKIDARVDEVLEGEVVLRFIYKKTESAPYNVAFKWLTLVKSISH